MGEVVIRFISSIIGGALTGIHTDGLEAEVDEGVHSTPEGLSYNSGTSYLGRVGSVISSPKSICRT